MSDICINFPFFKKKKRKIERNSKQNNGFSRFQRLINFRFSIKMPILRPFFMGETEVSEQVSGGGMDGF